MALGQTRGPLWIDTSHWIVRNKVVILEPDSNQLRHGVPAHARNGTPATALRRKHAQTIPGIPDTPLETARSIDLQACRSLLCARSERKLAAEPQALRIPRPGQPELDATCQHFWAPAPPLERHGTKPSMESSRFCPCSVYKSRYCESSCKCAVLQGWLGTSTLDAASPHAGAFRKIDHRTRECHLR